MSRRQTALEGGVNLERTRALLLEEWGRLGGTSDLFGELADSQRDLRSVLAAQARDGCVGDPNTAYREQYRTRLGEGRPMGTRRLAGVSSAIEQIDHFVNEERPRIAEAVALAETKKQLFAMATAHLRRNPDDTEVGRAFMALQELLLERVEKLNSSPAALHVMRSRPGPPIALLARHVIAPLFWSGYSWSEIAKLVDDGGGLPGRGERLRKLHATDPLASMAKSGSDLGP